MLTHAQQQVFFFFPPHGYAAYRCNPQSGAVVRLLHT